jgi:hypothetical protein
VAKLIPKERWQKHISERVDALKISRDFIRLRRKGLKFLGRSKLLKAAEWLPSWKGVMGSEEYLNWYQDCTRVGERFGLAPWTVEMACLLKGYRPEKQPLVAEVLWPRIRVVTNNTNDLFLRHLCHHAHSLGLRVVRGEDFTGDTGLYFNPPLPADILTPASKPPIQSAFAMRVEWPPRYPPEAARQIQKGASDMGKQLLLGYKVPKRLRSSPTTAEARKYKLDRTRPLSSGQIYDIVSKVYGPEAEESSEFADQRKRNIVKAKKT